MTHIHTADGYIRLLDQHEQDAITHARRHPDWPIHITVKADASLEEIIDTILTAEQAFEEMMNRYPCSCFA